MRDLFSERFINALKAHDIDEIRRIPKSDLHNHFVLGGDRKYKEEKTKTRIPTIKGTLSSMQEMHKWNDTYIGERFDSDISKEYLKLYENEVLTAENSMR